MNKALTVKMPEPSVTYVPAAGRHMAFRLSLGLLLIALSLSGPVASQQKTPFFQRSDTLHKGRRTGVYVTEAVLGGGALLGLNQLWYADYPRSGFHFTNDNSQWMQMDKAGHVFSSYYLGKMGMDALAWAGDTKKNQLLYGATLGFVFLTAVEVLDGFSEEWGFSMGDFAANALGTGLLIGQELLWDEQRVQLKFSFHTTHYSDMFPDKLGSSTLENLLKDYNGQTYWLSFNLRSFFKDSKIPPWLNVSLGYGANGLPENSFEPGTDPPVAIDSYRQFFTSVDIDLTKIPTNSDFLRTVFNVFNFVKIPAPSLEYRTNGSFRFHWLYY